MLNLIVTTITFYGGLIALGFLTKWYIAVLLFLILFGHASHLDALFLRRKDLRRELNILALEDLMQLEELLEQQQVERGATKMGDNESSHLH